MNGSDNEFSSIICHEFQRRWDSDEPKQSVLTDFFNRFAMTGLIHPTTLDHIQNWTPINRHFWLQLNTARIDRGVASLQHPNPKHMIAFKDGIPCFCCPDVIAYQWPEERAIAVILTCQTLYLLPNISPIFRPHFTIVSADHRPQDIDVEAIIDLAAQTPGAWVIQNGADAGATNPWHFHLQLFYMDDIPLNHAPFRSDSDTRLDHPALVHKLTDTTIDNFRRRCVEFAAGYLGADDHRRLNVIIRNHTEWTAFFVCRDTRHRTTLYRRGQPGYAEPAGFISAVDAEAFERWTRDGDTLYAELMRGISPDGTPL